MQRRIVLVSGNANIKLAEEIAQQLKLKLVDPQLVRFLNGEIYCEIAEHIRGADVFVIQPTSQPVNDHLMELLIMIDALKRASASSITAVIPSYGYARQDRKTAPRSPISAKLVADLITVAGATRVITMDLHAGQIQGFFNIPFDNIYAAPVHLDYIRRELFHTQPIFVSPDAGGVDRVRAFAKKMNTDIAMIDKRRTAKNVAEAMNVIGDVEGRDCIILDDMIDTAGTLVQAARALKAKGANKIYACATHGVFSGPALDRIMQSKELERVIVTNTIDLPLLVWQNPQKFTVLSTASLLAQAIHHTFNNESLSNLFI